MEQTSITIFLNGQGLLFNISKNTSCDDVITMAVEKLSLPYATKRLAIFECSTFRIQKMLPGQTKLLKQVRSWGVGKQNFTLEIREIVKLKSKMAALSRAKSKLLRLKSKITKHEFLLNNLNLNTESKGRQLYDRNITVLGNSGESGLSSNFGKKELLRRYLNESIEHSEAFNTLSGEICPPVKISVEGFETGCFNESELPKRTPGDGEEDEGCDEISTDDHDLNLGFITHEILADSLNSNEKNELDDCFIYSNENSAHTDSFRVDNDLNECMLYDDETGMDDIDSSFEEDSDYESLNDFEKNVSESFLDNTYTKIKSIKRMFSNSNQNARITNDDLLESFMHTVLNDNTNDDGLSSAESDSD